MLERIGDSSNYQPISPVVEQRPSLVEDYENEILLEALARHNGSRDKILDVAQDSSPKASKSLPPL